MKNIRTFRQLLFRIFVRPFFPFGQWVVLSLNLMPTPAERQPYTLGYLRSGVTMQQARTHLCAQGFFPNRIAYDDPGQTLSMRRLCEEFPDRQYHIRIFKDGEIRGHYEYTPEDRPGDHMNRTIFEKRENLFHKWIKDIV